MIITFIKFVPTGTIIEWRIKLFHPWRGGESRCRAGGARDEGPRGNQDSRSLQIVPQV
jgi:hypothetical protein